MDQETIGAIIITVITTLGGVSVKDLFQASRQGKKLEADIEQTAVQTQSLRTTMEIQLDAAHQASIERLSKELERAWLRMQGQEDRINKQDERIAKLIDDLRTSQSNEISLKVANGVLNDDNERLKMHLETANGKITFLEGENARLSTETADNCTKLEELSDELQTFKDQAINFHKEQ
jgi:chromosome segregation ATPase